MPNQDPKDTSDKKPQDYLNHQQNYGETFDTVKADEDAYNKFVASTGILMMHWAAIPDVIHQKYEGDIRTSFNQENDYQFEDREDLERENNFIYVKQKSVYVTFTSNNKDFQHTPAGLYNQSGGYATINRHYKNTTETVALSENDKLIPCEPDCEVFSVNYEKYHHNPTGIDRLQYPSIKILYMIDSAGRKYHEGLDFTSDKGVITWTGPNRPGTDPDTGRGRLVGVRYTYKPYFYVKTVLHDFRSVPTLGSNPYQQLMGTNQQTKRGPMQALLQADYIFLDRRTNESNRNDAQLDAQDTENTDIR